MDFAAQDIVNYLCASAGAIPADRPGIYLAEQDETELIEKLWTGTETAEELVVAEDVRENTPALFLQDEKERYAFSVDINNNLQRHRFDKNLDEWVKDNLQGEQPILIHGMSRLSGGIVDETHFVFFENLDGQLQAVRISHKGECQQLPPTPGQSQQGRPHSALVTGDGLVHLFYVHQEDNSIHHFTTQLGAEGFEDVILSGTDFDDVQIVNFLVIPYEDLTFDMFALLSSGRLVVIDKIGTKTLLGQVKDGQFTAASSEECVIEAAAMVKKGIKAASGIKSKGK